jgi:hypothetical protein
MQINDIAITMLAASATQIAPLAMDGEAADQQPSTQQ